MPMPLHMHTGASWESNLAVDDMLGPSGMLAWSRIQAVGGSPIESRISTAHPSVSALFGTYAGLPPLYITAGGDELLLDDARVFAEKARAAGVDVTFTVGAHMEHAYAVIGASLLPESRAELQKVVIWMRARLGLPVIAVKV